MKRWASVVVLVLVAMSLGRLISDHLDTDSAASAPFVRTGVLGKPVALEYLDVTVHGVRAGRHLVGAGDTVAPGGLFLIVDSTLVATREPVLVGEFAFVDAAGRRFPAESRASACSETTTAPTAASWHVMSCFDVPRDPDLLVGGRLVVSRGDESWGDTRRDDVADIDLGIDRAQARELAGSQLAYKGYLASFEEIPREPVPLKAGDS